jgi:hypothetical protein
VQVAGRKSAMARMGTLAVVRHVYEREGVRGFWRGAVPRMTSVALWGTAMCTTYEALKRLCVLDDSSRAA